MAAHIPTRRTRQNETVRPLVPAAAAPTAPTATRRQLQSERPSGLLVLSEVSLESNFGSRAKQIPFGAETCHYFPAHFWLNLRILESRTRTRTIQTGCLPNKNEYALITLLLLL